MDAGRKAGDVDLGDSVGLGEMGEMMKDPNVARLLGHENFELRRDILSLKAENGRLNAELATAKDEAEYWAEAWKIGLKENFEKIAEMRAEIDRLKTGIVDWKTLSGQLDGRIKGVKAELAKVTAERDDLAVKLEKLDANKRNQARYTDAEIDKLKNAYKTLMDRIYGAWFAAPTLSEVLNQKDEG